MKFYHTQAFQKTESAQSSDFTPFITQGAGDLSYPTKEFDISPAIAAYYLKNNQCGRRLTELHINSLANAILEDRWKVTGDPIRLGVYDPKTQSRPLYDGQHRLSAIVKANRSARCVVIEDFPAELWALLDGFKPRNAFDLIYHKFSAHNASQLATAARYVWYFERQQLPGWRKIGPDNEQIINCLERHDLIHHWVSTVVKGPFKSGIMAACCYWLISTKDTRAEDFVKNLVESYPSIKLTDPIYLLREKIEKVRGRGLKGSTETVWLIFRTWQKFINEIPIKQIKLSYSVEKFPWPGGAPYLG
jgi:hypothetical protein